MVRHIYTQRQAQLKEAKNAGRLTENKSGR